MKTSKGYFYNREFGQVSSKVAHCNSFKYYKKYYLNHLIEFYGSDSPGMEEFCHCALSNPIEEEAHDGLAELLNIETPNSFHCDTISLPERELQLRKHHFCLSAAKKFSKSRLVQRDPTFDGIGR